MIDFKRFQEISRDFKRFLSEGVKQTMEQNIFAFAPILWLLAALGFLKVPSHLATLVGLGLAAGIAFSIYDMVPGELAGSIAEGAVFGLFPIIWVIVSALFVYDVTQKSGSMETIKRMLAGISTDRRIQGLILAYAFGGFLESIAGFGTAVAIPAAMMIAIGFPPFLAAVVCLIANTVPVAFGVLGIPILTLAQVTGLPLERLAFLTSLQLFPFAILLPFLLIVVITGSVRSIKGVFSLTLFSGLSFALGQTLTAFFAGPELAAVAGSLLALSVLVVGAKRCRRNGSFQPWRFGEERSSGSASEIEGTEGIDDILSIIKAWMPYILILLLIGLTRSIPALEVLQEQPFVIRQQFYFGPGGYPLTIPLFTSGGSLLFFSAVFGGLVQGLSFSEVISVFSGTLWQTRKTIITVLSIVALAKVMSYSGMTDDIAVVIASISGGLYPLIAPFIGMLGTFVTGSDTSSNVLFGNLQKQTALQLHLNPEWIAASGASGATAGKMISPQSLSVATAVTGLVNQEGKMLRFTLKYCMIYVALMGLEVFLLETIL